MDPLLPLVLGLMTWVFSERYYPDIIYLESWAHYWTIGLITTLLITFSIIVHEIGHSFMARTFNIPIERIHLFLFGGMAELRYRPQSARQELGIAVAGPLASFMLAAGAYFMYQFVFTPDYLAYFIFRFMALINLLIGVFNLLPIYPLDGGRIARALIWMMRRNYILASRQTGTLGSVFSGFLVLLALADYFFIHSGYSLIAGILALYMFYTYYTGRNELRFVPDPFELIQPVEHDGETGSLIRSIATARNRVLHKCIIPLLDGDGIRQVVDGNRIHPIEMMFESDGIREMTYGDYLDPHDSGTFGLNIDFRAEWVPVIIDGKFEGMCDALEMRFWLYQQKDLDIRFRKN